jgi:hypothetical protein
MTRHGLLLSVMIPFRYHFAKLISKIAVAYLLRPGVGDRSDAGLRLASDSGASSRCGTLGRDCRPAAGLAKLDEAGLDFGTDERSGNAKLGSRPWPKLVPSFQSRRSNPVLAATGRACEARQGQAPRGREVRATPTSVTNVTTDTDTVPPALPEWTLAEPRGARAKPEISRGRTAIRFNPFRHGWDRRGERSSPSEKNAFTP